MVMINESLGCEKMMMNAPLLGEAALIKGMFFESRDIHLVCQGLFLPDIFVHHISVAVLNWILSNLYFENSRLENAIMLKGQIFFIVNCHKNVLFVYSNMHADFIQQFRIHIGNSMGSNKPTYFV